MPYSTLQGIFTKRGAENETRTIFCNILKISDLEEAEKTSGET